MDDETLEFESRLYVNPEVSLNEQDEFIEKFRAIQGQNQAQINRDTYNLGTPVTSNLGGLTGAEGLWEAQYQRPQVNAAIENLRQVGIQQAVNTAMANQQNAIQERINQAKRAYYRAQNEAAAHGNSGGGSGNTPDKISGLGIETTTQNPEDLAVRENEEARKKYESTNQEGFNEAMNKVTQEIQSGNYGTAGTVGFSYEINGRPVYGQLYRDRFGKITGVSTPTAEYNADAGKQWLLDLARKGQLKNSAGQVMEDIDVLLGV